MRLFSLLTFQILGQLATALPLESGSTPGTSAVDKRQTMHPQYHACVEACMRSCPGPIPQNPQCVGRCMGACLTLYPPTP
ncbi:hypothetical protein QBC34DRAFT_61647 [Podospora aff. communis PSN243]|uniref:Uncharacterized protein n=1 Tax=Podospora aff. communis PSN243 TaxID=3040156 RepID=A0AAV9GS44_9PEZI|nr:hypothetical protein QBC34DRAFT_61647 [Podospora aff. communis PSN243]